MATFTIPKASTKTLRLTLTNNGSVVDLTNQSTLIVNISNRGTHIAAYTFALDGDPTLGKIQKLFVPADTSSLGVGHYNAQAVVTFVDTSVRKFGNDEDEPYFDFIVE